MMRTQARFEGQTLPLHSYIVCEFVGLSLAMHRPKPTPLFPLRLHHVQQQPFAHRPSMKRSAGAKRYQPFYFWKKSRRTGIRTRRGTRLPSNVWCRPRSESPMLQCSVFAGPLEMGLAPELAFLPPLAGTFRRDYSIRPEMSESLLRCERLYYDSVSGQYLRQDERSEVLTSGR